jgi:low affinity Fe/Cu permease
VLGMAEETMPSQVAGGRGFFDRFADHAARFTSRAAFFAGCVLLVLIWAPSYWVVGDLDTWQLLINTPTTVVTFLLVGLAQNTTTRADAAIQQKLNAIVGGSLVLLELVDYEDSPQANELRAALGIEHEESA